MLSLLLSVTTCLTFLDQGLSFIPSATLNQYHSQRHARTICSMSLFDRIRSAIVRQQPDSDIGRITECWDRFATGVGVERYLDPPHNLVLQTADCFVQGLSAMPFHETEDFPWAVSLQEHSVEIWKELSDYNAKADAMKSRFAPTESEWLPPRDSAGTAYGPEWKTLGLQDRSVWDEERILDFPVTVKLLKQFNVPSCEAFFAKQGNYANSNFFLICHIMSAISNCPYCGMTLQLGFCIVR